jgi:hypothetical protein
MQLEPADPDSAAVKGNGKDGTLHANNHELADRKRDK